MLQALAAELLAGAGDLDVQVTWAVRCPPWTTRRIVGALLWLVEQVCGPQLAQIAELEERNRTLRKNAAKADAEAMRLGLAAAKARTDLSMKPELRRMIAQDLHRRSRTERDRARQVRRMLRAAAGELATLRSQAPSPAAILAHLPRARMAWSQAAETGWPDLGADLHRLEAVGEIVAVICGHALAVVWEQTPPRCWRVAGGRLPAPAPDADLTTRRQWTVTADKGFDPPLPAGTVVDELLDEELTGTEYRALRASRSAARKAHEARLFDWRAAVRDAVLSASPLREDFLSQWVVWREHGAAGREAATEWLDEVGERLVGVGRAPERPPAPRPLLPFRWPLEGGSMRYGNSSFLRLHSRTVLDLGTTALAGPRLTAGVFLEADAYPLDLRLPEQLFPGPLVVLDTETTGRSKRAEVHEIGAVLLGIDGSVLDGFEGQGCPNNLRLKGIGYALEVSGLTVKKLAARTTPIAEVLAAFRAWWLGCGSPPCTAYNLPFDRRLLAQSGLDDLRWGEDIMRIAKLASGEDSFPLKDAGPYYGVATGQQTHRALDDARLAARVLCAATRQLKAKESAS